LNNLENAANKDHWFSALDMTDFTVSSSQNIGVASPGSASFMLNPTTSSILTSDGHAGEDFTVTFKSPSHLVGFNTYLIDGGYATITVTGEDGKETVFRPAYDPKVSGFFGISSQSKIQSVRWQSPHGVVVKSGISDILKN
jgi:hypothetical protein